MKKIIVIVLLLATSISVAQFKVDTDKDKIYFSKDYNVNLPKQRIIQKTNEWLLEKKIPENRIERLENDEKITVVGYGGGYLKDLGENGTSVVFNGVDTGSSMLYVYISYLTKITFKEKEYSVKIENYTLEFPYTDKVVRLEDYVVTGDYQSYVNKIKKEWENNPDSPTKKAILERILDKGFSKLDFGQRTRFTKKLLSGIEGDAVQFTTSIFEYVSE